MCQSHGMCGPGMHCGCGFERHAWTKEDKLKALEKYERNLKEELKGIEGLRSSITAEK